MNGYLKILAILLALIYIMSPYDFLPDILFPVGWIDDAFILGLLVYFLRRGRLPAIFSYLTGSSQKKEKPSSGWAEWKKKFTSREPGFEANFKTEGDTKNPYEILGVKPGVSEQELRAAYYHAAQLYHPDKVSHLGPELQQTAIKKFLEIHEAYVLLQNKAGR